MRKNERAKSMLIKTLLTLALAFVMILVSGTMTKAATTIPAAPGQVTGVKQMDAGTDFVKIQWGALVDKDVKYSVQIYDGSTSTWKERDTTSDTYMYIRKLSAATTYKVKIVPYVSYYDDNRNVQRVLGKESAAIEVVTAPNSMPSSLKHTKSTYTSITVKWSAVQGANTYRVEYKKDGANSNTIKQVYTTKTSIELKKLSKNSEYDIWVYAGRKTSTGSFVEYSNSGKSIYDVPVRPAKVSGLEIPYYWQYLKEIVVDCDKNAAADGYQWQLYTAYKGKDTKVKSINGGTSVSFSNSAIGKHNFYKVRVRAYCIDGNNKKYYSPWTSWKYVCPQPGVTLKSTSKGIKASWDKIKGADRYIVYMSTKQDSGYKKVATTKNASKVITKFGKSKLKSGKTYYFRVVAQNKVGKKYYSGAAGNATKYAKIKYKK